LSGDLLQCAIGCRGLDAGDQPDQPIVAELRPRAVQQGRLDDAFRGHPLHGQQPRVQVRQDTVEMRGVAAGLDFADRLRVADPQAGISARSSCALCGAPHNEERF